MNEFGEGFLLQASLIFALGAQNIFVLESGLKRRRQFLVAALCSICDLLLIAFGVLGAATVFLKYSFIKSGFGIAGVAFLAYYGYKKIKEAFSKQDLEHHHVNLGTSTKQVVLLSLSFSLLNPHVFFRHCDFNRGVLGKIS